MSELPATFPLADLRAKAEAWRTEITTPGHYGTEAFHALEDALLGDGPDTLLALVGATERLALGLDQIIERLRKPNGVITNEWYWEAVGAVESLAKLALMEALDAS